MKMGNTLTTQLADLILGIDHVAIAVEDIGSSIAWYSSVLGFSLAERGEVSGEHSGMKYAVMKSGNITIVLTQGTSPASQVSKFLAASGSGVQHIAFTVTDLDEAINRVTQSGGIADTPVIGDDGIRQAFLQRDPATCIRVELIERHSVPFSQQNIELLFRALEEKDMY
jgi:methylmalonyl-CoA/ethylmalonyl-CoA epimerase